MNGLIKCNDFMEIVEYLKSVGYKEEELSKLSIGAIIELYWEESK